MEATTRQRPPEIFRDRADAGRQLAVHLHEYAGRPNAVVLGLARGGVPVAFEVAQALGAPLDVFLVRKLGVPGHEELALGAIASGGVRVVNEEVVRLLEVPEETIAAVAAEQQRQLERRERLYRDGGGPAPLAGRTAIVVDDGLATGASMRAAALALREQDAGQVVAAVPVAPPAACAALEQYADRVVCAHTPELFYSVGAWYEDFSEVSDDEVRELLRQAMELRARTPGPEARLRGAQDV
jgi:putative phosphoribosyl transferase